MLLNEYYSEDSAKVFFSRPQASDFAKLVAGDFNPIHDVDSKRFCVPGDLLFAVALKKYGLSQQMRFTFSGMVTDNVSLNFPESGSDTLSINDDNAKEYLRIERGGAISTDPALINDLTQRYVEFSGQTFPHILVPLMANHDVMVNTDRPLVIYESMLIDIDDLDISRPQLELSASGLNVDGKRGHVCLEFSLTANGKPVGKGAKNIVLSGLREYDQAQIDALVRNYTARKQTYLAA